MRTPLYIKGCMWELLTERSRRAVWHAHGEAQRFGHRKVGSEHLLLGILNEGEGVAVTVIKNLGLEPDALRNAIENQMEKGEPHTGDNMVMEPEGKRVIDTAYEESNRLGDDYIGTHHFLMGILRGTDATASTLKERGLDMKSVKREAALLNPACIDERISSSSWLQRFSRWWKR